MQEGLIEATESVLTDETNKLTSEDLAEYNAVRDTVLICVDWKPQEIINSQEASL